MRRPGTPHAADFFGGGPADGERRRIDDDATTALVTDGGPDEPEAGAPAEHVYVRQPDGRFRYAGVADADPEPAPLLPELADRDEHAHALAALRNDSGPHPVLIVLVVAVLAVVMYAFALYA